VACRFVVMAMADDLVEEILPGIEVMSSYLLLLFFIGKKKMVNFPKFCQFCQFCWILRFCCQFCCQFCCGFCWILPQFCCGFCCQFCVNDVSQQLRRNGLASSSLESPPTATPPLFCSVVNSPRSNSLHLIRPLSLSSSSSSRGIAGGFLMAPGEPFFLIFSVFHFLFLFQRRIQQNPAESGRIRLQMEILRGPPS